MELFWIAQYMLECAMSGVVSREQNLAGSWGVMADSHGRDTTHTEGKA